MGAVEERASSSMSTSSSKASRIPRLNRSRSLRERPQRLSLENHLPVKSLSKNESSKHNQKLSSPFGLYRSASFATTRGMKDIYPGSQGQNGIPPTPELKRKFGNYGSSYVSPYSIKSIAAERKTQSFSAPSTKEKDPPSFYSPQVSRRSISSFASRYGALLHTSPPHSGKEGNGILNGHEDEDDISERSFGSASSAPGCDLVSGMKSSGFVDFWSRDRLSRNILHCSHAYEHDPDDYLTPTQRASRKIKELQGQLKKARREISEKDQKISMLTRELVQLRMKNAEGENIDSTTEVKSEGETSEKEAVNHSESRKSPPLDYIPSCLTPSSEESEHELKMFTQGRKANKRNESNKRDSNTVTKSLRNSPASVSFGDSDLGDLSRSLADSGHYEDLPSPCLSSRDSIDSGIPALRKIISSLCTTSEGERNSAMIWASVCAAEEGIKAEWSRRLEQLKANHMEEYHEMKERHNDKVEMLLSKLSDANLKYFELRPLFDKAQEKARHLEKDVARLKDELRESEIRHQKVYFQMYMKGQQSAKLEENDKFHTKEKKSNLRENLNLDNGNQNMVLTLMKQLAESEDQIEEMRSLHNKEKQQNRSGRLSSYIGRREEIDPEITLQFLKSAIYYFLTDKDNAQGHLKAIESILGYSSVERGKINKYCRI